MRLSKRLSALILTVIMMLSILPATAMAAVDNGWEKEGDVWYYYKDGEKVTNQWVKDGGKWYYLSPEGAMTTNSLVFDFNAEKFYIVDKNGVMVTKAGWYNLKNAEGANWYYLKKGGEAFLDWKKIDGKWYYFHPYGAFMINSDYAPDGFRIKGDLYFFNKDGSMKTNSWVMIDDKWSYVDKSGLQVTGWKQISKKWYFFDNQGYMICDDWVIYPEDSNDFYYFGSDGVMVTNKWIPEEEDGVTYWSYIRSNGVGAWGWEKIGGKWYYFDPDDYGIMVFSTTMAIGGKLYTFDENGVCLNP